jgi:DNA helicase-2/ATP-dependent DNA helicase PcrA
VISQIRNLETQHPELRWGDFAILYRTNAQSRAFEEVLTRYSIPYQVVGGLGSTTGAKLRTCWPTCG